MDYADAIRRQAEDAPRAALPAVTKALWTAFAAGQITEAEAEALSALIEARGSSDRARGAGQTPNPTGTFAFAVTDAVQDRQNRRRTGVGSRPRSNASLERRRRWAASGRLPPALAARFTLAEHAVLALVAAESTRRGDCRLSVPHLAAVAGVAETTVRNALREGKKLGLLTIEERRLTGYRNDTNVLRIISPEWTAWLRLARRSPIPGSGLSLRRERKGGGCKSSHRTPTEVSDQGKTRTARASQDRSAGPNPPVRAASRVADA